MGEEDGAYTTEWFPVRLSLGKEQRCGFDGASTGLMPPVLSSQYSRFPQPRRIVFCSDTAHRGQNNVGSALWYPAALTHSCWMRFFPQRVKFAIFATASSLPPTFPPSKSQLSHLCKFFFRTPALPTVTWVCKKRKQNNWHLLSYFWFAAMQITPHLEPLCLLCRHLRSPDASVLSACSCGSLSEAAAAFIGRSGETMRVN